VVFLAGGEAVSFLTRNPLKHSPEFRRRRFLNWFPLGLTYATMYMGRYNFNVIKNDIGAWYHLDKAQMGLIATFGFWTYGLSVMLNGPLADRIGGRKAILIGALGAGLLNLGIGLMFFNGWTAHVQSFGALSVVKVNSTWFHVRERGIFGGIFGIMISSGYFLATTIGSVLLASFANWNVIWFVPAAAMGAMFLVDLALVRNRPSHAGYADFDTGDGSNAHHAEDTPLSLKEYLAEVYFLPKTQVLFWWTGVAFMLGGILGGLVCGWMSDNLFQSRRPPVAFIFYLVQVVMLTLLGFSLGRGTWLGQLWAVVLLGLTAMFIFGVHGMLSGTASMDFGGRKAAATVAGALDGIQYVGSGLTGFGLGWILKTYGWDGVATAGHTPANAWVWVACIIPFSLIGALIMTRIWHAKPGQAAH
jgi:OPA family glycerol-3-phosphate transporter-like MFS transporter